MCALEPKKATAAKARWICSQAMLLDQMHLWIHARRATHVADRWPHKKMARKMVGQSTARPDAASAWRHIVFPAPDGVLPATRYARGRVHNVQLVVRLVQAQLVYIGLQWQAVSGSRARIRLLANDTLDKLVRLGVRGCRIAIKHVLDTIAQCRTQVRRQHVKTMCLVHAIEMRSCFHAHTRPIPQLPVRVFGQHTE